MSRYWQLLAALLWLPLSFFASAEAAELRVTPALCAIGEDEEKCRISVTVMFTPDSDDRYCLTIARRELVECFTSDKRSEMQIAIAADEDVQFQVTEAATGNRVAGATLKVAKFRPKRHKRRYGWGLL